MFSFQVYPFCTSGFTSESTVQIQHMINVSGLFNLSLHRVKVVR